MKPEEIVLQLKQTKEFEKVLAKLSFQEFEDFVAWVCEKNGFRVRKNLRFKLGRKHEIDVVAEKENFVLCIDCKKWSGGRYKKSQLKKAAQAHEAKCKALQQFLKDERKFFSLIVTLMEEDLLTQNSTVFIPAWKLNSFLLEAERYLL